MDLKFINELTDEEWIALINFSTQHYRKKNEMKLPRAATWVKVSKEPDRKDLNGDRYALISSGDGIRILDSYRANDFCFSTHNVGLYGEYPPTVLDQELRIFLATRFGENYLKELASYFQKKADEELAMLAEYTTLAKEK